MKGVDEDVVPYFREAARNLLAEYSDPEEALARALAKVTGHVKLQVQSGFIFCSAPPLQHRGNLLTSACECKLTSGHCARQF